MSHAPPGKPSRCCGALLRRGGPRSIVSRPPCGRPAGSPHRRAPRPRNCPAAKGPLRANRSTAVNSLSGTSRRTATNRSPPGPTAAPRRRHDTRRSSRPGRRSGTPGPNEADRWIGTTLLRRPLVSFVAEPGAARVGTPVTTATRCGVVLRSIQSPPSPPRRGQQQADGKQPRPRSDHERRRAAPTHASDDRQRKTGTTAVRASARARR